MLLQLGDWIKKWLKSNNLDQMLTLKKESSDFGKRIVEIDKIISELLEEKETLIISKAELDKKAQLELDNLFNDNITATEIMPKEKAIVIGEVEEIKIETPLIEKEIIDEKIIEEVNIPIIKSDRFIEKEIVPIEGKTEEMKEELKVEAIREVKAPKIDFSHIKIPVKLEKEEEPTVDEILDDTSISDTERLLKVIRVRSNNTSKLQESDSVWGFIDKISKTPDQKLNTLLSYIAN